MVKKLKHLEFIQGVVNRLSQNSFLLKGWSVVLVSALLVLSADDSKQWFVFLPLVPAIVFWGLDGYFLRQERLYRKLYDHVRALDEEAIDFAMDISLVEGQVVSWLSVTLSKTLVPFHGVIVAAIFIVVFVNLAG